MQDEAAVLSALQKGVTAAVAQSDDADLPVKYIMVDSDGTNDGSFTTPGDGKWLEIVWIPNNPQGRYLGDEQDYRGILRLVLHWPNQPTGAYSPLNLLGSITRFFTKGKVLSGVQIYGIPNFTGIIEDKDDVLFPVSIYYTSYRKGA